MSEGKSGVSELREKILVPQVKDALILLGWIGGLILIAFLCWFFTQPVRNRFLQRAVNRVLEQSRDSRRLGEPAVSGVSDHIMTGTYFAVNDVRLNPAEDIRSEDTGAAKACVFVFIGEGSFFPCLAFLDPEGKVREFLPLNSHGERIFRRLSPGVLEIYTRRMEGAKS